MAVFVITLAGVWFVSLYSSYVLHKEIQHSVTEQQLSTVAYIASDINEELQHRIDVLTSIAQQISIQVPDQPAKIKTFLNDRPILQSDFNEGVFVTNVEGTAIVDYPVVPGRVGTNYMDRESVSVPLKEGKTVIGKPNLGKTIKAPIFSIVVPVHNINGTVIGTVVGTVNLGLPNFLDMLVQGRYGQRGGYLLVAPQYRLILTASDKTRIMEKLPPVGTIPQMDQMLSGTLGSDIFVNAKGVEVLNTGATIPLSGWRVVTSIPTSEAFESVRRSQMSVLSVVVVVTLITGILVRQLLNNQHIALHDPLTNLANRRLLKDRLSQALAFSRRNGTCVAALVVDLDNFKPLNDQYGHTAGDLLLVETASRLKEGLRDIDTVARLGGDEFVVILSDLSTDHTKASEEARLVAEKVCCRLAEPYHLKVTQRSKVEVIVEHRCTASIGVAVASHGKSGHGDIVKLADSAMYQAKESGRNKICFYQQTN